MIYMNFFKQIFFIKQRKIPKVYKYNLFKNNTCEKIFNPTVMDTSKTEIKFLFINQRTRKKYIYIICSKIIQEEKYSIQRIYIHRK